MNRHSQRGVALVITLIMLSIVTFMAVLFLMVTRRERGAVKLSEDQQAALLMAQAALARAESQIVANMIANTNRLNYDFMVSTNFLNPAGFKSQRNSLPDYNNVNYVHVNGRSVTGADLLQNIANLQYDARAPVFVRTNENRTETEFRYYLDFNRNGRTESNGWGRVVSATGGFFTTNGVPTSSSSGSLLSNYFVGDPEWIGVLEHPDQPHSESNRFVGRFAFLVLPTGKSLDLNFVHNHGSLSAADSLATGNNGYVRNQGNGSWELNMAGFLRGLNTNNYAWPDRSYRGYNPLIPSSIPNGPAFDDARALLNYRYSGSRATLKSLQNNFPTAAVFQNDYVDQFADGPFVPFGNTNRVDTDLINRPWPGSDNTNGLVDVQEILSRTNGALASLSSKLITTMAKDKSSSYDRYTFYRMLGQMGVDSAPALHRKVNLNYANNLETSTTNLTPWISTNFFHIAADALLKSHIFTNVFFVGTNLFTNYYIGDTRVRPEISVTNIQLYLDPSRLAANSAFGLTNVVGSEYSASIHRLLQVAANIWDATTNNGSLLNPPTLFRPYFRITTNDIHKTVQIAGFTEETNLTCLNWPWMQVTNLARQSIGTTNAEVTLFGQPMVLGAKKGYPNFNEFLAETVVQVTRKMELRKLNRTAPFAALTNQMYLVGISNSFGTEAWNSYTQSFTRPLELRVTNQYFITLSNYTTFPAVTSNAVYSIAGNRGISTNWSRPWPGNTNVAAMASATTASFLTPLNFGVIFITNATYIPAPPWLIRPEIFSAVSDPPQLHLYMTNRVQYILIDRTLNKIIDFVNLDNLTNFMNITGLLSHQTNAASSVFSDGTISESEFWNTNKVGTGPNALTLGMLRQLQVGMGEIPVSSAFWMSYNGAPPSGQDKDTSIDVFRVFAGTNSLGQQPNTLLALAHQAPFAPTRKLLHRTSWQANDPLVHYTPADLTDPIFTDSTGSTNNQVLRPPNIPLPPSNLGYLNGRYAPWGGNPTKEPDTNSFRLSIKDSGITTSDDWDFPVPGLGTRLNFPSVGILGRVHRGTPWQTIYLKSEMEPIRNWWSWSGSFGTHPTNDWKVPDLFTVALNDNAARGLLGVNQTNLAAWSAVLSGVAVVTNTANNLAVRTNHAPYLFQESFIVPGTPQIHAIVDGISRARNNQALGVFTNLGSVFATPELTVRSPFLNLTHTNQAKFWITDAMYERIPQQILSLIKEDEPRLVVYAFGQALRPAPRSLSTEAGFYNLCTNYQVTGEVATKTMLKFEGGFGSPNEPLRAVVENFTILPPE